jgi:hypothetical protein
MESQLSHAEQRTLYEHELAAWITRAAPAIAKRMREATEPEKRRMWYACSAELRKKLKRIA